MVSESNPIHYMSNSPLSPRHPLADRSVCALLGLWETKKAILPEQQHNIPANLQHAAFVLVHRTGQDRTGGRGEGALFLLDRWVTLTLSLVRLGDARHVHV